MSFSPPEEDLQVINDYLEGILQSIGGARHEPAHAAPDSLGGEPSSPHRLAVGSPPSLHAGPDCSQAPGNSRGTNFELRLPPLADQEWLMRLANGTGPGGSRGKPVGSPTTTDGFVEEEIAAGYLRDDDPQPQSYIPQVPAGAHTASSSARTRFVLAAQQGVPRPPPAASKRRFAGEPVRVIPPTFPHQPTTQFFINRPYFDAATLATIQPQQFHKAFASIIKGLTRDDGSRGCITNKSKCSPSLVLKSFLYLHRPPKWYSPDSVWPHGPPPPFHSLAVLNRYIQQHKYFIAQFYYFCCSGIVMDGIRLMEHQIDLVPDEELDEAYIHRFLLKKWTQCIRFD